MRQSGLNRPKYERPDYLPRTIERACRLQRDVLGQRQPVTEGTAVALELDPFIPTTPIAVSRSAAAGQTIQQGDVCSDSASGLVPLMPGGEWNWNPVDPAWLPQYARWINSTLVYVASVTGSACVAIPVAGRDFWIEGDWSQPAIPLRAQAFARLSGRGASLRLMGSTLTDGQRYVALALQVKVLGLIDSSAPLVTPGARYRVRLTALGNNLNDRGLAA